MEVTPMPQYQGGRIVVHQKNGIHETPRDKVFDYISQLATQLRDVQMPKVMTDINWSTGNEVH